jgi:hypothetical protein
LENKNYSVGCGNKNSRRSFQPNGSMLIAPAFKSTKILSFKPVVYAEAECTHSQDILWTATNNKNLRYTKSAVKSNLNQYASTVD